MTHQPLVKDVVLRMALACWPVDAESGAQLTTFTVRVEEPGKDGAVFKVYVFIECYGRVAERAGDVNAGDLVGIEGRLKWRSYTDRDGQKKGTLAVLARQVTVLLSAAVAAEVGHG